MFISYLYQGILPEHYQLNINILNVRSMDKRIVGVNAGNVWHLLNEVKRISIPELARRLNLSVESTALAIGWLARENKVCIHRVNGLIEVYDEDQFGFSFG
jgi:hypothetical protein